MNNSDTYAAFSFTLEFPTGITLANRAKPYATLPKNRFPYTEEYDELEDITTTTFEHSVAWGKKDNTVTMAISPNTLAEIKGNSGTVLRLYVDLDADIQPGLYPLIFRNIVFSTVEGVAAVRLAEASSYVIVGTPELKGTVDLSALRGYLPKDVANATSTLFSTATEMTGVNLSNLTEGGSAITAGNPNTLFYTKAESAFTAMQAASGSNVVAGDVCEQLTLTDGYPFSATQGFTAATASYSRTVARSGWYSACLPFAAVSPACVVVERFKSLDYANSKIVFEEGSIEADKPFIFKTDNTEITFTASNVSVAATPNDLTDGSLFGTYLPIDAPNLEGLYALRLDGSGFGQATSTAFSKSFRAFVNSTSSSAKTLCLIFDEGTAIDRSVINGDIRIMGGKGQISIISGETSADIVICSIDGKTLKNISVAKNTEASISLQAGVYIVNNSKVLVR